MFSLRFFGSFRDQRKGLLAAESFAPIALHPVVRRRLDALVEEGEQKAPTLQSPRHLFLYVLGEVRRLLLESAAWNAVNAVIVLTSVLATRELVRKDVSLALGCTLALVYLLLKGVQAGVEYFNHLRRLQVHRGVQASLYRVVNAKLIHFDPMASAGHSKGQLKTLIGSDIESIEDFISAALHQWVPTLVSTLVLVPALYLVSGGLGLFALFVGLLLLPVATLGAKCIEYYQLRSQKEQDSLTTLVGEWVKNIRLVRFLGWQDAIERETIERMRRYAVLGALRHTVVIVVFAISFSWSMLPLLSIFWLSAVRAEPLNLVEIFSTFWILDHLMTQIQHIPHSLSLYGAAAAGAKRVQGLLSVPDLDRFLLPEPEGAHMLPPVKKLVFKNLRLSYGDAEALSIPELELSFHERTAIVGKVGSGKTSLLEIIVGEVHPSSGLLEVELEDGTRAPFWRADVYLHVRTSLAYSPQQPFLSNTSLRLNIDLSGAADAAALDTAIAASQLTPDLLLFPRGIDEEVGESGINLSGGQKQRVSLARAFLSGRRVMVLDDPLSAVDSATESGLMDAIFARSPGLILVSHRLRELERCDRVLVLEAGRVVEDGVPGQLAADPSSHFSSFLRAVEEHG